MSFAEDIKNSNRCPNDCIVNKACDNCEYKEAPECVPLRIADNLTNIGYARLKPMESGINLRGVFRCVFLFEDNTYIELDNEMMKTFVDYINVNGVTFRRVDKN